MNYHGQLSAFNEQSAFSNQSNLAWVRFLAECCVLPAECYLL